jgi:hypothetical protein
MFSCHHRFGLAGLSRRPASECVAYRWLYFADRALLNFNYRHQLKPGPLRALAFEETYRLKYRPYI